MCRIRTVRGLDQRRTHTTARIIVERRHAGALSRVPDAVVEIRALGTGQIVQSGQTRGGPLETVNTGTWTTRLLRAGTYDVEVIADGSGPIPTGGAPVREAPWRRRTTFRPALDFPEGTQPNELRVEIAWRNPIIRVTVFDVTMDTRLLGGADVTIIGVSQGQTDDSGRYVSDPVPFGLRGVRVAVPNMFPQTQAGPAYFRQVELRENGVMGGFPDGRDLELSVEMSMSPAANLPGTHSRPVTIWASGLRTPHTVADDPSLPNPGGGNVPAGQDGWELGMRYPLVDQPGTGFAQLARRLETEPLPPRLGDGELEAHQVRRFAIVAHGRPGGIDVDQLCFSNVFGDTLPDAETSLTVDRMHLYNTEFERLRHAMHENGILYFASCTAAEDKTGEELLRAVSRQLPTIRVVGARTILSTTTMNWQDVPGSEPRGSYAGLRDTRFRHAGFATAECNEPELWNNLDRLPWFGEESPHATIALDGNIIRRGDPPG